MGSRMLPSGQCTTCGKQRYDTEAVAIAAALAEAGRLGKPLRIYRCPTGRGFHLTSTRMWTAPRKSTTTTCAAAERETAPVRRCSLEGSSCSTSTPTHPCDCGTGYQRRNTEHSQDPWEGCK